MAKAKLNSLRREGITGQFALTRSDVEAWEEIWEGEAPPATTDFFVTDGFSTLGFYVEPEGAAATVTVQINMGAHNGTDRWRDIANASVDNVNCPVGVATLIQLPAPTLRVRLRVANYDALTGFRYVAYFQP